MRLRSLLLAAVAAVAMPLSATVVGPVAGGTASVPSTFSGTWTFYASSAVVTAKTHSVWTLRYKNSASGTYKYCFCLPSTIYTGATTPIWFASTSSETELVNYIYNKY